MKSFFNEYGHLTLAAIVVALLVAIASPVGNLIKASTTDLIDADGIDTRVATTIFNISPTYGLVKTHYVDESQLEEGHVHDFTWLNRLMYHKSSANNRQLMVYIRHDCSCGSYQIENAPYTCVDNQDGTYTYTATSVMYPGTEVTETKQENFTVTLNGEIIGTNYRWGDRCALTSADGELKKWYVTGDESFVLADGTSTYAFRVTGNIDISYVASEYTTKQPIIGAAIISPEVGKVEYNVKWNIPNEYTVTSVKIYRAFSRNNVTLDAQYLIDLVTSPHVVESNNYVTTGDFTLYLTNLTSGRYQRVVTVVTYTDTNNQERQLISSVKKVSSTIKNKIE